MHSSGNAVLRELAVCFRWPDSYILALLFHALHETIQIPSKIPDDCMDDIMLIPVPFSPDRPLDSKPPYARGSAVGNLQLIRGWPWWPRNV